MNRFSRLFLQWTIGLLIVSVAIWVGFSGDIAYRREMYAILSELKRVRASSNAREQIEAFSAAKGHPLEYGTVGNAVGYYTSGEHLRIWGFESLHFSVAIHFNGNEIESWDTSEFSTSP